MIIVWILSSVIIISIIYIFYLKININNKKSDRKKIITSARENAKLIIENAKRKAENLKKSNLNQQKIISKKLIELEKLISQNKRDQNLIEKCFERNKKLKNQLDEKLNKAIDVLNMQGNISEEQAKIEILDFVKFKYAKFLEDEILNEELKWKSIARQKCNAILLNMLSNISTSIVAEGTTTLFKLDNPEDKAKIIGKDGRNLKAIQNILGVDILLKYSNDEVLISSFDPLKRAIASRVIRDLIDKKRLQPQLIEEYAIDVKEKLEIEIVEEGAKVCLENNVNGFSDNIYRLLGILKYRTSYGQTVLEHSEEVGKICKAIAFELDLDVDLAFKCGFLHDIGKALDHSSEKTHVQLGVEILSSENFDSVIINAVHAHHGDVKKESVYAEIVCIADAISASRPGARNQDLEDFVKRMKKIEEAILMFEEVENVYVLKSGRQIRVMVDPKKINDIELAELSIKIKEKVKNINTTPGEIVITLIRENRFTESFLSQAKIF